MTSWAQLAGSFNEMLDGLYEREQLRQAFGSYVDPDVAERVLEEGELLEGQEVEVTVLFVDVRDFTPFAERSSARETVTFLNELLRRGRADPARARRPREQVRRRRAARGVRRAGALCPTTPTGRWRRPARSRTPSTRRFGGEVRIGIGLNSGPVAVGSVGGGGRLEFAVIGDPVNVAARVEKVTRETGDTVLLTEATRCLLTRAAGPAGGARRDRVEGQVRSGAVVRRGPRAWTDVLPRAPPASLQRPEPPKHNL